LNRVCRIWLPYCAVLLISAFLYIETVKTAALPSPQIPADAWITQMWRGHPLDTKAMWREGFLLKLPALVVLLPQSWTLAIELVLSLLLPVGLLLIKRGSSWLLFFGIFSVTFLHVSVFLLHFMLGLFIAKYFSILKAYSNRSRSRRWLILLIGIAFYTAADTLNTRLNDTGIWLLTGLGAGLILMFVLGSDRTQVILAQPGLRQIGKVSYSIYLIHMAVLICITPYLLHWLDPFTSNHVLLWLWGWTSTITLSTFLAILSYHWLEVPSMALGRYLSGLVEKHRSDA
jgi:peptidoglycan/LPS O-acetylase OafA/YrhL